MKISSSNIYPLIWETRRLFQRLRATSDALLEHSGINASQRAVLEFLYKKPSQTVPQIAQENSVSRQHIQTIVNSLLEQDLAKTFDNPAHKRSQLIGLTKQGNKLFEAIQKRELSLFEVMESQFSQRELKSALKTLQSIDNYLASGVWKNLNSE